MALEFKHRRFDIDEYMRLVDVGILHEGDRVELLDGEIFEMSPIGNPHNRAVARLTRLLTTRFAEPYEILAQGSIKLNLHSMPEPDLAVLRPDALYYPERTLRMNDVVLLVEVAETSLRYDRLKKAPIYARGGIAEYWILDLTGEALEIYRDPTPQRYDAFRRFVRGDLVDATVLPGDPVPVDALLDRLPR
ncbi:MAG: Uma2 family endonuclease [Candidatus Baltobacteraceae bacterium]